MQGSFYDIGAFFTGEWHLLTLQHWGIIAGCLTYMITVTVVLVLLVLGGTFRRLREQSEAFEKKGVAAFRKEVPRMELYDELIDAAKRLSLRPEVPQDSTGQRNLLGKHVRLVPYSAKKHLDQLFSISDGSACYTHGPYDPASGIWHFLEAGPFKDKAAMGEAPFMQDLNDGLRFVVIDTATGYLTGMASLLRNNPTNLCIEIGDVWLSPAFQRTHVHTDLIQTLTQFVFGLNYRRVEWMTDTKHAQARKSAERVGFVFEGSLRKHRIVRGCNQDTALYSMTNSDWRDRAASLMSQRLRAPVGISGPSAKKKEA